jgi:hypothetical protein
MSKAFVTATALSTPFLPNRGIDANNVQEAIEKLSFLMYASSLAGAIYTDDGDVTIRIGVADTSIVLPSPTGRWKVSVNDYGDIVSDKLENSDTSLITYWRFKREDGSSVAVEITDDGEVIMTNPPDYVGINIKNFYLRSPSNNLFTLGVAEDGEFYTESAHRPPNPKFRVISQEDQVLFSTVEHRDLSLNYMPVYSISELPARPVSFNKTIPMAFVKSGALQKPAYHDGATWRYLNTDMPVVDAVSAVGAISETQLPLIPSSVGFWQISATDSGQITTSRYLNINTTTPLPPPVLVTSPVGVWYVSANESGGLLTQLISGNHQPSKIKLSSTNAYWEMIANNIGELFLQQTEGN